MMTESQARERARELFVGCQMDGRCGFESDIAAALLAVQAEAVDHAGRYAVELARHYGDMHRSSDVKQNAMSALADKIADEIETALLPARPERR